MIEDQLEKLRKEYLKTGPPIYLEHHGWQDLSAKLENRKTVDLRLLFGRGLAFTSIVILLFASIVGTAQAAKPGDFLYPIKLLLDEVVAKVVGKQEIKIERRGQEIIDLSSSSSKHLEEAAREYQKALDATKQESEKSGRQQEFKNTLEEQEEKFREAQEKNPTSQDNLEEVIRQTQRAKGEVQGEKDQKTPGGGNNNPQNDQQENQGQEHQSDENNRSNK